MIIFKQINVEGFASIVNPFSYVLNSTGVNLVVGNNGAGKSTVFNALAWAIYGKTLKPNGEVETWENLRGSNWKGTKVEVEFRVGLEDVKIIRCKDYKGKIEGKKGGSSVFLYLNGNLYTAHKNKADITKRIEQIVGMSFALFKNSLTFGQNLTRLLREKGDKQKELFDEAFAITYINKARDAAKATRDDLEIRLRDIQSILANTRQRIEWKMETIAEIESDRAKFEENKEIELAMFKEQLTKIKNAIKAIDHDREIHKTLHSQQSHTLTKLNKLEESALKTKGVDNQDFEINFQLKQEEAELSSSRVELKDIYSKLASKAPVCPACGQSLSSELHKAHRESLIKRQTQVGLNIRKRESTIKVLKSKAEAISSQLSERNQVLLKIKDYRKKLEQISGQLEALQYYPNKLKDEKIKYQDILNQSRETAKAQFSKSTEKHEEELKQLKVLEAEQTESERLAKNKIKLHDWLIKDALSNKGLKAYVFNSMLSAINKRLAHYSTMGWKIKFVIDLDSGNKNFRGVIFQGNEIRPYEDLSGGEQQLVDLSLAFAMHDVIADTKFNILLMDEVFESLDKDNIEIVIGMIQRKAKNTSIHIVTHRKEFVTSSAKVTYLEKARSGSTSIVR